MSYKCFNVSVADNIAHIVLSRPEKRNAMSAEFWKELPEIIRDIDDNAKARVIVISSTGPVFSAGIDIGMFSQDIGCLLYTSPSPRDQRGSRMPSSA